MYAPSDTINPTLAFQNGTLVWSGVISIVVYSNSILYRYIVDVSTIVFWNNLSIWETEDSISESLGHERVNNYCIKRCPFNVNIIVTAWGSFFKLPNNSIIIRTSLLLLYTYLLDKARMRRPIRPCEMSYLENGPQNDIIHTQTKV